MGHQSANVLLGTMVLVVKQTSVAYYHVKMVGLALLSVEATTYVFAMRLATKEHSVKLTSMNVSPPLLVLTGSAVTHQAAITAPAMMATQEQTVTTISTNALPLITRALTILHVSTEEVDLSACVPMVTQVANVKLTLTNVK